MSEKAKELLVAAMGREGDMIHCFEINEYSGEIPRSNLGKRLELIGLALDELQKQPPASEFTKGFRAQCEVVIRDCGINQKQIATVIKNIGLAGVEVRLLEGKLAAKEGLEACKRLDQQAEDNKNQAAENEWLKKENDDFLKMTELLEEHPEGYEGPCYCKLCMSYG